MSEACRLHITKRKDGKKTTLEKQPLKQLGRIRRCASVEARPSLLWASSRNAADALLAITQAMQFSDSTQMRPNQAR
jgi:hypothetical protein